MDFAESEKSGFVRLEKEEKEKYKDGVLIDGGGGGDTQPEKEAKKLE